MMLPQPRHRSGDGMAPRRPSKFGSDRVKIIFELQRWRWWARLNCFGCTTILVGGMQVGSNVGPQTHSWK